MKVQIDMGMPSRMSQPIGTYIDQTNRLIVAAYPKGLMVGLLFGPIGILTVDAIDRSSVKRECGEPVSRLNADWSTLSTNIFTELLQEKPPTVRLEFDSGTQSLTLRPYGILNVQNQTSVKLFAVLEATLSTQTGETLWEARYFVPTEHAYSLTSAQGWTTPGVYQSELTGGLKTAYSILLRQIDSKPTEGNEITAEFLTPYMAKAFPVKGQIIGEENGYVLFQAKLADAIPCAGCYVLKKKDIKLVDQR